MEKPLFTIGDVFREGWRLTKENIGFLITFQVILFFLSLLPIFADYYKVGYLHFLSYIVFLVANMGLYNSTLLITSNVKPGFDQLYLNWRKVFTWFFTGILFSIMFLFGILLLVVPGIYLITTYYFYPYFILEKGSGVFESLDQSAKVTKGLKGLIFRFLLACLGLNILGFVCFGVGLLFTIPITLISSVIVYRRLTQRFTESLITESLK